MPSQGPLKDGTYNTSYTQYTEYIKVGSFVVMSKPLLSYLSRLKIYRIDPSIKDDTNQRRRRRKNKHKKRQSPVKKDKNVNYIIKEKFL